MSISNSDRLITHVHCSNFWKLIAHLQAQLQIGDRELAAILESTPEALHQMRTQVISPGIDKVVALCERLGISISLLLNGEIDYPALRKKYLFDQVIIPEKYTHHAFGTLFTFQAILQFLVSTGSGVLVKPILSNLQMNISLFENPDTPINIQLYQDATEKLSQLGVTHDEFKMMGIFAARENLRRVKLKELAKKYTSHSPLERSMLVYLDIMDQNHHYKIEKLTSSMALVSARPQEHVQDTFKNKTPGNRFTSIIKEGVFSGVPHFVGESIQLETNLVRNIHQGDPKCVYEIRVI